MKPPLRLKAETPEDLEVFAAPLQDAIVQVADMAYLPKNKRFALSLNRFRWEEIDPATGKPELGWRYHRTTSGLHFDSVLNVQSKNISQSNRSSFLNLLDLKFEPGEDGAGTIVLIFSGGASLRLNVECIDAHLVDRGAPWTTKNLPTHEEGDKTGEQ
ncbi:MAG: DUF2948 family protein [Alphaproteobacteria bacterium]|nr:MAG: DUF2948 family protein [Alphaproteobacteria bacterium]